MTGDESTARTGPSRRRVLATGALAATGAVVGGSHAVGAVETRTQHEESAAAHHVHGAMFPYHYAPASQATIVETDLEWLPERLSGYQTHVLEYGHARSFRGFLFAEEGEDGNGNENKNDDGTPSSLHGRTVSLERTTGAPASASNLIGVEATVLEGD
ncbi:hypothetical protein [Halopiger aswanensis]|uniref:Uncharacterized protein n=1 Tax=Halopiger aswanensis TaxID=148449 RepID=A0A419WQZ3_9EURY|nr:hypothetical protein [Halopiger aswanensis]RKD97838.1 hypothetical protein ATJ93_0834 [Halopiger aswanensis]